MMRMVGRFRELERAAEDLPSIFDARDLLDRPTAQAVSLYLDSGVPAFDVMEAVRDPFDPSKYLPGGSSLLSDGEWVWRADLAYFVKEYRVALPDTFISRAKELGVVRAQQADVISRLDHILTTAGWK